MRTHKAFTLIELLIVVAIIAILAAIAVPNFLEAQVRSKVSRAKADMRSLATAVESYAVDYNRYPIASQFITGPGAPQPVTFNNRLFGITTPVAFISSLPLDVFRSLAERNSANDFPVSANQPPTYEYVDYWSAIPISATGETYVGLSSFGTFDSFDAWDLYYTGRTGAGLKWTLMSVGPDKKSDFQQIDATITVASVPPGALILGSQKTYDPTNGTVSTGDIVRTGFAQRN